MSTKTRKRKKERKQKKTHSSRRKVSKYYKRLFPFPFSCSLSGDGKDINLKICLYVVINLLCFFYIFPPFFSLSLLRRNTFKDSELIHLLSPSDCEFYLKRRNFSFSFTVTNVYRGWCKCPFAVWLCSVKSNFVIRITHYDVVEWVGDGFLQDMKHKRPPCPHCSSNTLRANNLPKINLEWALSYEWEFYEFVRSFSFFFILSAGWMDGWKNMVE